jgi:hypothetical protein
MIYKSAFERLKGVKSITFYAVPLLNKYNLVSDLVSNSASMLLLSAGLIYSVILYQHLESADSKKVLILSKKVDVPKTEKPLIELGPKQIIPFEAYKTIDYHSYTK